jgi:hypothetical protein
MKPTELSNVAVGDVLTCDLPEKDGEFVVRHAHQYKEGDAVLFVLRGEDVALAINEEADPEGFKFMARYAGPEVNAKFYGRNGATLKDCEVVSAVNARFWEAVK